MDGSESLAERVRELSCRLAKLEGGENLFEGSIGDLEFCVVCGVPRVRGDVSGMTCGSMICLSRLPEVFKEVEKETKKELEDICAMLQIDESGDEEDSGNVLRKIKEKVKEMQTELRVVKKVLFPQEDDGDEAKETIPSLVERIKKEIEQIEEAMQGLP